MTAIQPRFKLPPFHRIIRLFQNRFKLRAARHGKGIVKLKRDELCDIRRIEVRVDRIGIPLVPPPSHPFNPLLALRLSSLPMADETRRELITRLFDATWAVGSGVTDPMRLAEIATA